MISQREIATRCVSIKEPLLDTDKQSPKRRQALYLYWVSVQFSTGACSRRDTGNDVSEMLHGCLYSCVIEFTEDIQETLEIHLKLLRHKKSMPLTLQYLLQLSLDSRW